MLITACISFLFVHYYSDFNDCTVLLLLINVSSVNALIRTLHIRQLQFELAPLDLLSIGFDQIHELFINSNTNTIRL